MYSQNYYIMRYFNLKVNPFRISLSHRHKILVSAANCSTYLFQWQWSMMAYAQSWSCYCVLSRYVFIRMNAENDLSVVADVIGIVRISWHSKPLENSLLNQVQWFLISYQIQASNWVWRMRRQRLVSLLVLEYWKSSHTCFATIPVLVRENSGNTTRAWNDPTGTRISCCSDFRISNQFDTTIVLSTEKNIA